jgi:Ni/Co efflux regulator RcnB
MKMLLLIVCSVALINISALAQVQQQDTSSTDYNAQPPVEERDENTQSDDMKTDDAERTGDQEQSTEEELEKDVEAMQENFEESTIDKVGPNGEKLFMERGKYFYIDDEGRKVKVKKSEVRDKSQNP